MSLPYVLQGWRLASGSQHTPWLVCQKWPSNKRSLSADYKSRTVEINITQLKTF